MPQSSDEQGLVALICNKKIEEMTKVGEKNIQQAIHKILGGQNNIQVLLDSKKKMLYFIVGLIFLKLIYHVVVNIFAS